MNNDDTTLRALVPADGKCRALVFFAFEDTENPAYEVTEFPIIAWHVESDLLDGSRTVEPVIPVQWMNCWIGVLYEDGRVSFDGEVFKDRDGFERQCVEDHVRHAKIAATA